MKSSTFNVRRVVALAALLAASAGATLARAQDQNKDEREMEGSFDQPLRSGPGSGSSNSTTMMSENDGEHTYTVKIQGDKVTAEIDGKAVPKSRVVRKDGQVQILDKERNVLKSFDVGQGAPGNGMTWSGPRFKVQTMPGQNGMGWAPRAATVDGPQPKAMMGVTLSDAGDDEGATIDTVGEGKPAEKAGLKAGDRVTEADGKKITGQKELREIIRAKEPGDTVTLKIDRDGSEKTIKVTLAKYEAPPAVIAEGGNMGELFSRMHGVNGADLEKAQAQLEKAMAVVQKEKLDGAVRERLQKALQAATESLTKAQEQMAQVESMPQLHQLFGNNGQAFVAPVAPTPPTAPTPPSAASPGLNSKLDRLSEQLEKLNQRIDSLEKKNR